MVKVTPRTTIAQSYSETSEECNDSYKEPNDSKVEKKVSTEPKSDYSKISHGISINLGNVSMSNSCGSTQLPRIAEEKDSPTGSKADDYSKEVLSLDKIDKNNTSTNKLTELENITERSNDRVELKKEKKNSCTKNSEGATINKIDERVQLDNSFNIQMRCSQNPSHKQSQNSEKNSQASSQKALPQSNEKNSQSSYHKILQSNDKNSQFSAQKFSQTNERGILQTVQQKSQNNEKVSQVASQKLLQNNEKIIVPHKVIEQKTASSKNSETNSEGKKISKKYKIDGSESTSNVSSTQHLNTFEVMGSGKDKKNN